MEGETISLLVVYLDGSMYLNWSQKSVKTAVHIMPDTDIKTKEGFIDAGQRFGTPDVKLNPKKQFCEPKTLAWYFW